MLPTTMAGYEALSRERLPRSQFDMLFGSPNHPEWLTYENNIRGFRELCLRPRVLVDSTTPNLEVTVLGQKISLPVMLPPASPQTDVHPDGELASARAAGAAGTLMALSPASSYSLEEVAGAASGPLWYEVVPSLMDRESIPRAVKQAEQAGYCGLILVATLAARPHALAGHRHDSRLQPDPDLDEKRLSSAFLDMKSGGRRPPLTWADVSWYRSLTSLPLIVKGIQTAEDARLCVEHGLDALIVSNHGGRVVQAARATIEALPEIVEEVGGRLEVYLDSGVRRGTDVLLALALGARAVLVGRPMFWGLSVAGEAGVRGVLETLRTELQDAMALTGVADVRNVPRTLVSRHGAVGRPLPAIPIGS